MIKRRAFLGATLCAAAAGSRKAQSATLSAQNTATPPPEPLVWPVVTKLPPDIRSFAGHTDTVPDIVGRIGTPPSLVIFTEGNHLMALLSDDIVGAFPSWARSQPQYADPVVPFEALDQPSGFGGRECLIEGSFAVDVEVVLDQDDNLALAKWVSARSFKT